MDQPLFGEQKKSTKVSIWLIAIAVTGFVAFTVIMAVVFGFQRSHMHLAFAFSVTLVYLNLVLLFFWWYKGDLEPKFNYLLLLLLVGVLILCITAQFYLWHKTVDLSCGVGEFRAFDKQGSSCYGSNGNLTDCRTPDCCLRWSGTQLWADVGCNQTSTAWW